MRIRNKAKAFLALVLAALLFCSGCSAVEDIGGELAGAVQDGINEALSDAVQSSQASGETPAQDTTENGQGAEEAPREEEFTEATEDDVYIPPEIPEEGSSDNASTPLPEDGEYSAKEDVALYLHHYGHLPANFMTKKEARKMGWEGGSLEDYVPGMCIGGDQFGNYEGLLPEKAGRQYYECDIDTLGASKRGAKRIVYSNDGLIYYTADHYESFTLLYGEVD